MRWVHDDGGRKAAGFRGETGDCVTRAIAIATGLPYLDVYQDMADGMWGRRQRRSSKPHPRTARDGVERKVYEPYLFKHGWVWTPTMKIGSGCQVHLTESELPSGRLIVAVSKHLTAVIDGEVHDIFDPSRGGTRCVYGYYQEGAAA